MLIHIIIFIWKTTLTITYYIYNAIIKSVITHEAAVWHKSEHE